MLGQVESCALEALTDISVTRSKMDISCDNKIG